jgi:hypothetical protein
MDSLTPLVIQTVCIYTALSLLSFLFPYKYSSVGSLCSQPFLGMAMNLEGDFDVNVINM